MKQSLLFFLSVILAFSSYSQNVNNPGFENVYETSMGQLQPDNWVSFMAYPIDGMNPPVNNLGLITTDSYSGEYALEMTTSPFNYYASGYFTNTLNQDLPLWFSHEYTERPANFNFYYKFQNEGVDTAFVTVLLFRYDIETEGLSLLERMDTISFNYFNISEDISQYAPKEFPLIYVSDEFPEYAQITFSSGINCDQGNCTPGTTLWVDDVSFSGGTLDIDEEELGGFTIYPNPASSQFRLSTTDYDFVELIDLTGKTVKVWSKADGNNFEISELKTGLYFLKVYSSAGELTRKLIKG